MNEELQQRLLKYMDHLEEYAREGGDFVAEQTPLVVQELLTYKFWYHLFAGVGLLTLAVVMIVTALWCFKEAYKVRDKDICAVPVSFGICLLLVTALPGGTGFHHAAMAMKVHLAPRVFLLEYVADMVK